MSVANVAELNTNTANGQRAELHKTELTVCHMVGEAEAKAGCCPFRYSEMASILPPWDRLAAAAWWDVLAVWSRVWPHT